MYMFLYIFIYVIYIKPYFQQSYHNFRCDLCWKTIIATIYPSRLSLLAKSRVIWAPFERQKVELHIFGRANMRFHLQRRLII